MRWILALALTAGIAHADEVDTELGPFPQADEAPAMLEMHETTDPCGELAGDRPHVACARVASSTMIGWQGHAFLACRLGTGMGTCSLVKVGGYLQRCTATLAAAASIHTICRGEMALPVPSP